MRRSFTILLVLLTSLNISAHEGELISISQVKFSAPCEHVYINFQMENVNEILLKDVQIDLMAGDVILDSRKYRHFPLEKFSDESFVIAADQLEGINPETFHIAVSHVFGIPKDWGGWHGLDPSTATYNDIGDHEIYADAPWRMDIYDANENLNPVPINVVAHDGNELLLPEGKPFLEFIDIYIKKSSEDIFGAALNFNDLSQQEFQSLIKAKSPDNLAVGVQSFDLSLTQSDEDHTMAFMELYNANRNFNYTNLKNSWWFFTLMLPASELTDFDDGDHLDIRVAFSMRDIYGDPYERNTYLRVFRNSESIPTIPGFLRGDTHVHTYFSQSVIEFGNPISATKEAARAIGIDWVIITDHTTDFDNWVGTNIADAWVRLGDEIDALNADDPSIALIKGQEVSLLNGQDQLVHFLAYPGYETPTELPYLGDGGGDGTLTGVHMVNVLRRLEEIDGFAYAAHPFATVDELPLVGGLWNIGDNEFPSDGQPFVTEGLVNCNAPGQPSDLFSRRAEEIVANPLKGAQIWGVRSSLSGETDPFDPYNIRNEEGASMFEPAPGGESNYLIRYRQGEEVVNFVNKKALKMKNENPELQNFKFYFSAGTDAHGSFNYSNTSGFGTVFTDDEEVSVSNYAFGNISCVTYCPNGAGAEGEHALRAMYDGNFSLSDGPIVILGASLDGDNTSNELMMGGDVEVQQNDLDETYLNFEFVSTTEFGALDFLRVFVGTEDGETSFLINDLDIYSDAFQWTLNEVVEDAGIALPVDEYFYVRAELQTEAIYGPNSPKILEGENFHSFTNPIWFRVNSFVTGVDEELQYSFKIYPNPVDRILHLESSVVIDAVNIFDAEGRLAGSKKMRNNSLDVSNLPAGTYLLVAEVGKARINRNFVVQ